MQWHPVTLQRLRVLPARRPLGVWMLVFGVLLKAATPLLVALCASERAVPVAEICSVYGVRPVALEQPSGSSTPFPSGHGSAEHCVLTPLLGAAMPGTPVVAAVHLHAPLQVPFHAAAGLPLPPDAGLAWLAGRTHAPPPRV